MDNYNNFDKFHKPLIHIKLVIIINYNNNNEYIKSVHLLCGCYHFYYYYY